MSFSIGRTSVGRGPRGALHSLGQEAEKGKVFDLRIVLRL